MGAPVTLNNPKSAPARAYADAARQLNGELVPLVVPSDKSTLLNKLFGRRAASNSQTSLVASDQPRPLNIGCRSC